MSPNTRPVEPCPGCDEGWRIVGESSCQVCSANDIAELRRANAWMYGELQTARAATALLDRMQEPRVMVLPDGGGVVCGGRQDGWLCWRHPDGQWVTKERLPIERISPMFPSAPALTSSRVDDGRPACGQGDEWGRKP